MTLPVNQSPAATLYCPQHIQACLSNFRAPTHIYFNTKTKCFGLSQNSCPDIDNLVGTLPAIYPEWLGDRAFTATHNLRFAYVGGAMARGIASAELVIALGKIGCMGFFGSAGLPIEKTEQAIVQIKQALDPMGASWGVNLIHTPATPHEENALIDLYLHHGVTRVSAAAFMGSNKALTRFVCKGLYRDEQGLVQRRHYIFPKVSRPEVAQHFLQSPPADMLQQMVNEGAISANEAQMVSEIPLAEDLTVESDSGGHTDGRPLNALFGAIVHVRDQLQQQFNFAKPVRLGAAGGLGDPASIAAAYALGAAYVLLGSVHQSALESGLSNQAKGLLAHADIADTIICPSADMFEIGGKVQVLKKGTMMGVRGNRLWEIYNRYSSLEAIPTKIVSEIEKTIFRQSLSAIWQATEAFFTAIDPQEISRAEQSPKYKMALLFRWYLGNSSKWALQGEPNRQLDYQIWCGPAMGTFNRWTQGSFLQDPANRRIDQIALNLLEGAALHTRAQQLKTYGLAACTGRYQAQPICL